MSETVLDEIIHHTGNILPVIADAFPEQSKRITKFVENLQEKRPEIAKRLLFATRICK